uniref:Uncharacterized protein n=1 Tax=Anguilla anguilla TaxID=7936 RepID=A0A0E9VQD4_ANGAN
MIFFNIATLVFNYN